MLEGAKCHREKLSKVVKGKGDGILNRVAKEGVNEKMTFKERLEDVDGVSHMGNRKKRTPVRGNS